MNTVNIYIEYDDTLLLLLSNFNKGQRFEIQLDFIMQGALQLGSEVLTQHAEWILNKIENSFNWTFTG